MRRPPPDPVHRWRLLARVRGRATAARPGAHRRVRGVERRRRGRLGGRRAPRGGLGRRGHRGARPGGVLRLPGQPAQGRCATTASGASSGPPPASSSRATTGFGSRDVVLVEGIEPSTRWRSFTIELLEYAERLGVSTFVTLGALLADVPHTRPIPVTATSDDEDVLHRLDLESSAYEGPTGIVGVISDAANRAGLPSVCCWAAVPHYAGSSPSPKATLGLLDKLESLFDVTIPLGDLPEAARAWERGVDELAEADDEVGRVRPVARGVHRHRRPARGERRRDRARVRALPAPSRRRGHPAGAEPLASG